MMRTPKFPIILVRYTYTEGRPKVSQVVVSAFIDLMQLLGWPATSHSCAGEV